MNVQIRTSWMTEMACVGSVNVAPASSAVGKKLIELGAACDERGLTLSRWQSNGAGHRTTVSYAVHTGARADQLRWQDGIVGSRVASQEEGKTEKCEAYRDLCWLLEKVNA